MGETACLQIHKCASETPKSPLLPTQSWLRMLHCRRSDLAESINPLEPARRKQLSSSRPRLVATSVLTQLENQPS